MASKNQIANLKHIFTFVVTFAIFLVSAAPALARNDLPTLEAFVQSVLDGHANVLRGVYIQNVMAYPVVQQPMGNPGFVSTENNLVTQFSMASEIGNVGLLAHNYMAGSSFSQLANGQEVALVYGDGKIETYIVSRIARYQALNPNSAQSDFRDLDTGIAINTDELFRQVYRGDRHVTFQTCIEFNEDLSWGRLFVIADPKPITSAADNSLIDNFTQYAIYSGILGSY